MLHLFTISDRYIKLITETYPLKSQNQQKQTIAHLNKKCNECENEKSELEIKCGYQDATITDLNTNVRDLELTIVQLTEKLGDQENEIENLKKENSTLQDNQMKLRIQYDDEKKQYETEYAFMLDEKDRQIQHISEDKDKQIKDLADEKEKLTDLINSNNTSISRQQQEELNRKININLMSLKEYQLKLAACENDIRIQNIQFLECQQALQKCNYDKQSDQEEYNNLLVSQNHYVQECQQKLLDCKNSKEIKYDEYNTLVNNINEANKYNIETLERLYTKPTLSNSDIIHCFSSIFPLDDDNESKATGKSQIEAIINKFIHQLNTERDNYIHEEREKDIRDRISRLNYINNNDLHQNNNILNIFTNEEERNLFNQILEKFKTNIIDETVYEHERQIIPYVNENDHLKRQLDEPNYVAKLLIDAVASIVLVKEIITKRIVDLEKDHKGTNEEVIKVYAFVTILYTLFQKEIRQDLNANNVQRFYYIILNVIRKSPSDNIHEILALQQQNDLHVKTLQEENETITSNLLTIQQTNASLQDSNKQMLSELSETRMHLSMINHDETSVDPIEYEETQMNKFTLIIQAVTTQLDAYLAGTCNNKYLRSAFEKLSMRKMFCKNEMAKSEMMQLFISLSNHIFKFIFCAQFYKNLVTVINDNILRRSIQLNLYFSREMYNHKDMLSEILNIPMINEAIEIAPVFPILYNISKLTLINGTYSISNYEDNNQIVSIDNEKKNLKSIALLHEANMEAEKSWFLKNLKVKYESVLGDDSILKAIASQKVSSPETVEKTTTQKRDKTNLKDAKQRTKDKTQGRRQVEALTEKKNLKDRHINTIRGGIVENK
nr:MATH and LRR domain-containing protein PFE0570w-like [Procambarus clarkii]